MSLGKYAKLIAFIVGAALALSVQVWGTSNHWVELAVLVATGLGIYRAPPPNQAGKP